MAAGEKPISELLKEVVSRLDSTPLNQHERLIQLNHEVISGPSSHCNNIMLTLPTASISNTSSASTTTTGSMQQNAVQSKQHYVVTV